MPVAHILFLSLIVLFEAISVDSQNGTSWVNKEHFLYQHLTEKYFKSVPPVTGEHDTLEVKFGMALISIVDLDETKQVLHTTAWLRYQWKDVQLQWDPKHYNNVNHIRIPSDKIWTPDIVLYNNHKDSFEPSDDASAVVYHSGLVLWVPPVHLSSHCDVDLQRFPFDKQVCKLKFGSWTYPENKLNLTFYNGDSSLDLNTMAENAEFKVTETETKGKRNAVKYPCCPETYVDIEYSITLERKANYATHMFIVPSVLLCFVLPAIFILPPESKEKIFFGVGLMMSNAMVLTVITDMVPAAHPTLSAVGLFHMINMILTAIALAISTVVMNIWAKGERGKKLPGFVQSFILGVCGRCLRVPREDFMQTASLSQRAPVTMRSLEMMSDTADQQNQLDDDKEDILRNFAQCSQRAEWRQLAIIIDRACFIIYVFIVVVTVLALSRH